MNGAVMDWRASQHADVQTSAPSLLRLDNEGPTDGARAMSIARALQGRRIPRTGRYPDRSGSDDPDDMIMWDHGIRARGTWIGASAQAA